MTEPPTDAVRNKFQRRHWISYDSLQALPFLPKRVAIDELKEFGAVNLRHTRRPGTVPALRAGFYKVVASDGRLYVVEVCCRRPNGEPQPVWLYRPIVRVKTGAMNVVSKIGTAPSAPTIGRAS